MFEKILKNRSGHGHGQGHSRRPATSSNSTNFHVNRTYAAPAGYATSSFAAQDYANTSSDFALRPGATRDASQPVEHTFGGNGAARPMGVNDASVTISRDMYMKLLNGAERARKYDTLLDDAAASFSDCHKGVRDSDPRTVLRAILQSASSSNSAAANSSGYDSDTSSTSDSSEVSAVVDTSSVRLVIMTKAEHRSWLRLSGLNSSSSSHPLSAAGRSDWLQPMRHIVAELALTTKRLEMRFNVRNMDASVQQQFNLERMTFESQYCNGSGASARHPKSASTLVAQMTDELTVVAGRLAIVQNKAEEGAVPFCKHAMDLGVDSADPSFPAPGSSLRAMPKPKSALADGRTAHANALSSELDVLDVAKGYTVVGLAADTFRNYATGYGSAPGSAHHTASALDITRTTWSRCDPHIRRMLGPEPSQLSQGSGSQPARMLANWIHASSLAEFHVTQVTVISSLQDDADEHRKRHRCPCSARVADAVFAAASAATAATASKSSSSPPASSSSASTHRTSRPRPSPSASSSSSSSPPLSSRRPAASRTPSSGNAPSAGWLRGLAVAAHQRSDMASSSSSSASTSSRRQGSASSSTTASSRSTSHRVQTEETGHKHSSGHHSRK